MNYLKFNLLTIDVILLFPNIWMRGTSTLSRFSSSFCYYKSKIRVRDGPQFRHFHVRFQKVKLCLTIKAVVRTQVLDRGVKMWMRGTILKTLKSYKITYDTNEFYCNVKLRYLFKEHYTIIISKNKRVFY